ncbi:Gfo/Idh/MocA family oxidoreductase [Cellulophaga sp. HaHaR_3_176]|uniref:Gfo/Idh/MocA family protein n=1 Tax=Cellulophaga sp. HaHaR_3_176 TaxID=1942464 RepID=UPI001C1FAE8D|nr:Gfo/Idh/MocA family oxidoreductase [Cellulophaga sp. HaHaR_3_176]QWX85457.1 Gfo/Idh/MocA family oxidoreductase [Cellulophaga sp. HaHaR_3_176]
MADQKIRWGVIGLGNIAHQFVKDLLLVKDAELIAVASRDRVKADEFGKKYKATHCFGSYEELYACEEVDIIYIATPHSFHAENAIVAMNHGKHVLCEKPIGVNTSEVTKMVNAAKNNGVFLMEALWTRFFPTIKKIKEIVAEGTIGEIKYINADFAFYGLNRSEESRLLNPNLAGGSLLDIGIYPIFLAYLFLGKPEQILAASKMYKTGVEIQTSMLLNYKNAQAILYSGINSKVEMKPEISGTKGSIILDATWHLTEGYTLIVDGETTHFDMPTTGKGFFYEIEEVHSCLKSNKMQSDLWSHQNSLDIIGIIDTIRAKTGIVFPFEK